jgi:hypothetical protein
MIKIGKNFFIFYVAQIIVILIIDKFFPVISIGGVIGTFIAKAVYLSIFSFVLLFVIFAYLASRLWKHNDFQKRRIEFEDFLLTSSAIVTAFLLEDLLTIFRLFSNDPLSIILTAIIGIPVIFYGVYQLNFWISAIFN